MIMQDQSKRLSEPLRWGRREKTAVAAVLACVVLVLIGLGAYALTTGAPARADCIDLTFASTLGGAQVHACGPRARRVCASGAFHGIEQELEQACHKAGYPVVGSG
jgi:hypothetical protein